MTGARVSETVKDSLGQKDAIIFISDRRTPRVEAFFNRLCAAARSEDRVFWLQYVRDAPLQINEKPDYTEITIGAEHCQKLKNFPNKVPVEGWKIMPGNLDCILFALDDILKEYNFIWWFESDVDYSGDLTEFFCDIRRYDHDLICTRTRRHPPDWQFRRKCILPDTWSKDVETNILVFLPFFRISQRLLHEIRRFYIAGGSGHYEWTWSTVAMARGCSILDIGGEGILTQKDFINKYYDAGTTFKPPTFRFRPIFHEVGREQNKLWHPVKDWEMKSWHPLEQEGFLPFLALAQKYLPTLVRKVFFKMIGVRAIHPSYFE